MSQPRNPITSSNSSSSNQYAIDDVKKNVFITFLKEQNLYHFFQFDNKDPMICIFPRSSSNSEAFYKVIELISSGAKQHGLAFDGANAVVIRETATGEYIEINLNHAKIIDLNSLLKSNPPGGAKVNKVDVPSHPLITSPSLESPDKHKNPPSVSPSLVRDNAAGNQSTKYLMNQAKIYAFKKFLKAINIAENKFDNSDPTVYRLKYDLSDTKDVDQLDKMIQERKCEQFGLTIPCDLDAVTLDFPEGNAMEYENNELIIDLTKAKISVTAYKDYEAAKNQPSVDLSLKQADAGKSHSSAGLTVSQNTVEKQYPSSSSSSLFFSSPQPLVNTVSSLSPSSSSSSHVSQSSSSSNEYRNQKFLSALNLIGFQGISMENIAGDEFSFETNSDLGKKNKSLLDALNNPEQFKTLIARDGELEAFAKHILSIPEAAIEPSFSKIKINLSKINLGMSLSEAFQLCNKFFMAVDPGGDGVSGAGRPTAAEDLWNGILIANLALYYNSDESRKKIFPQIEIVKNVFTIAKHIADEREIRIATNIDPNRPFGKVLEKMKEVLRENGITVSPNRNAYGFVIGDKLILEFNRDREAARLVDNCEWADIIYALFSPDKQEWNDVYGTRITPQSLEKEFGIKFPAEACYSIRYKNPSFTSEYLFVDLSLVEGPSQQLSINNSTQEKHPNAISNKLRK